MTIPTDDYGLDGFCVRPEFLEAAGFGVGSPVQIKLSADSPAFDNLNGYRGTIVGAHFTQDVIAVKLDNHPSQQAAYFSPSALTPTYM